MRAPSAFVLVCAIVAGCGSTPIPSAASPTPSAVPDGFPTEVLGMPVLSVGGANQLIAQGKLDGRIGAVGGWWIPTMVMSCPRPAGWMAELETYCNNNIFASRSFAGFTCTSFGNGSSCSSNGPPPGTEVMAPVIVTETSAGQSAWSARNSALGVPMVLIGHVGDPRQWHCPIDKRPDCARKFVVDRVAWVDGQDLSLEDPNAHLQYKLTVHQVEVITDAGAEAIVAAAIHASEAPTIDPRPHATGDQVVWLVRTIADGGADESDPTRAVDIALVDDATGRLLQSQPLALDAGSRPALVLVQATTTDECCSGDLSPFYRIEAVDGAGLVESQIGGWSGGTDHGGTRWGAGAPAVLDSGQYVVRAWRAGTDSNGDAGAPLDACDTTITLAEGQEARVQAAFPRTGPCTFVAPTFEDPFG